MLLLRQITSTADTSVGRGKGQALYMAGIAWRFVLARSRTHRSGDPCHVALAGLIFSGRIDAVLKEPEPNARPR
jgi:hypothetical protein